MALHLLRSLLREASYLPDHAARLYFRRYIVARFKAYQPRPLSSASVDVLALDKYRHRSFRRRHTAIIHARAALQQRKAHKALNLLRRANQGEGRIVQKLLWFAYGRLGRRKYALLDDLLKPDPAFPDGPAPLQQLYRSNLRCLQYFDAPDTRNVAHGQHAIHISKRYPRLRAVVTSQAQNEVSLHKAVKRSFLRTPILNTWEQPMPMKRAANNVRRWYADTMTRLLPPLPAEEWDSIHAMSRGTQRIGFVKRRTPAVEESPVTDALERQHSQPLNTSERMLAADFEQMLQHSQPMDTSKRQHSQPDTFEQMLQHHLAMDKRSKADRPRASHRPQLTPRYMQRLYARLLTLTCKLEYDPTHNQWNAIWGELPKSARPDSYASPVNHVLFAGVDAKGIKPRAPKTKQLPLVVPRNEQGDYFRFPFFAEMLPDSHPIRIDLDRFKKERADAYAKWVASGGDAT